jgi:hypothetical protein
MYGSPAHLIIGFHGCDKEIGESILAGYGHLKPSENEYDWLGSGRYFWEGDLGRAEKYAEWMSKRTTKPSIKTPFVIGAIIDLGHCLNLVESENLTQLEKAFQALTETAVVSGVNLPENKPLRNSGDLILRNLDCLVIETVHKMMAADKRPSYDSVRGVFWEGDELYPNAGFKKLNHMQICVRNPNCIKGYFRPLKKMPEFPDPGRIVLPSSV